MLATEREKLENWDSTFINIGISESGERYGVIPVLWQNTSTAFNMKRPKVYISKDDLADEEIMSMLSKFDICGCYVFCDLDDYSFLNNFKDIYDLTIYEGANLKDISFIKHMNECKLLTLVNANLENLDSLIDSQNNCRWRSVTLYNSKIDDISGLIESKQNFNEFIIYNPKDRNEREIWNKIQASTFRYYDLP